MDIARWSRVLEVDYERWGTSALDGKPIAVIATGVDGKSHNPKTGAMVQTWIIRSDIAPHDAVHTGDDSSVCGACPLRGEIAGGRNVNRKCYVSVWQAPRSVFVSYQRGTYPRVSPDQAAELFAGKRIRLGAYGNPSAAPLEMWRKALAKAQAHTGYIHNWREADKAWRDFVMASVESPVDMLEAQILGYRTFRVRSKTEALMPKEVICPASKEANHKTNCYDCRACGGLLSKAKASIAIMMH